MKMNLGTMTLEQAAQWLRQAAEMTASNSQNWNNFEAICLQMLTDAQRAAQPSAAKEGKP